MITAAQLRAARGLLDWTRNDLAKAAGISSETVKNIEHGTFRPQETTADAIIKAFGARDVVFSEHEGVKKSVNTIINYEGRQDFKRYADDIYNILQRDTTNRTIYIFGNNDKEFVNALGDYADVHLQRMSKLENLKFKALVVQGIDIFVTKYIEYRRLPNIAFAIPFSVYEDRFDFIIYGEGEAYPKVVVIKSRSVADAYREQFEAMWTVSQPIK